jgi:hypothetical protein
LSASWTVHFQWTESVTSGWVEVSVYHWRWTPRKQFRLQFLLAKSRKTSSDVQGILCRPKPNDRTAASEEKAQLENKPLD